ncbi:MAG: hypothetical protein QOI73_1873 [Solirubrobacteraceae bacterium]|nr:hypothetical protein [Solirubrobacteraceae bacterium]
MFETRDYELNGPPDGAIRHQVSASRLWVMLVVVVAVSLPPLTPPEAAAGTYVMRSCDVPGYGNGLLGPWQHVEGAIPSNVTFVDECNQGTGMNFTFRGTRHMPGNAEYDLFVKRPSSGPQSKIKLIKVVYTYSARLLSSGSPMSFLYLDGGDPAGKVVQLGPPGGERLVVEQALNPDLTDYIAFGLRCDKNGAAQDCFPLYETPLQMHGIAVTLSEDVPPFASPLGGTLLASGPQAGIRTVTYGASDSQSGLASIDVLAGDTIVARRDLASRCPNDDFTVCPVTDQGELEVDTRTLPNGSYPLSLRVKDAAGNQVLVQSPNPIEIANTSSNASASGSSLGASTTAPERLAVRFAGSARSLLHVPFGRRIRIRGQLTGVAGGGIAGARIEIRERNTQSGARELSAGSAATKSDGTFSFLLARGRPSRSIRLSYRNASGLSVSRTLRLRVQAASSLIAALRGTVVQFRGHVLSKPVPKKGKRVFLQGRAPGYTWATFATARTNRTGRFSGRYRLPVRRPGVKLQIRVVVPMERNYPYASYNGRPIVLRVR